MKKKKKNLVALLVFHWVLIVGGLAAAAYQHQLTEDASYNEYWNGWHDARAAFAVHAIDGEDAAVQ